MSASVTGCGTPARHLRCLKRWRHACAGSLRDWCCERSRYGSAFDKRPPFVPCASDVEARQVHLGPLHALQGGAQLRQRDALQIPPSTLAAALVVAGKQVDPRLGYIGLVELRGHAVAEGVIVETSAANPDCVSIAAELLGEVVAEFPILAARLQLRKDLIVWSRGRLGDVLQEADED